MHQRLSFLALTSIALGSAIAQTPAPTKLEEELSRLCSKATAADEAETSRAIHRQSVALRAALQSESAFWTFLIDPSTPYKERIAAAFQGSSLISAQEIPRLWRAYVEFGALPAGVNPSPCIFRSDASWYPPSKEWWLLRNTRPPQGVVAAQPETRTILGFTVNLPTKAADYPLDLEHRNGTPWIWQMQRALDALVKGVRQYYAQPDRYPKMAEVALQWQPANFYEQRVRAESLIRGPRNLVWIETLTRLALQDGNGVDDLYVYGGDSYRFEKLVHTAQVVILQQTLDKGVAARTTFQVVQMARLKPSWPFEWKPLRTGTSMLAIVKWATNRELDDWTRYYCFAAPICRMLDQPPFEPDERLDPGSLQVQHSLAKFEAWVTREQPRLEQEAAKERKMLTDLAMELHQPVH
ncbi:MAG TPA: hypothetical protein VEU96_03395 [Bryobacteraceae bacterium]|nr:hypothetical protein [Bryobacteraceae bacterium]